MSLKVGDKIQLRWGNGWSGLNWLGFKNNMKDPTDFVTITHFNESKVGIQLDNGYKTSVYYTDIVGNKEYDWLDLATGPGGR